MIGDQGAGSRGEGSNMDTQMPAAYAEFDRFGAPTPAGIPATARLESVEVAGRGERD